MLFSIFNTFIKDLFVQREDFALHGFLFPWARILHSYLFHIKSESSIPRKSNSFFLIRKMWHMKQRKSGLYEKSEQFSSLS